MRLASDLKVQAPRSPRFGRQRAGRKGIGRFAAQKLGDRLVLTTRTEAAPAALRLSVDWRRFVHGRRLEDVSVSLDEVTAVPSVGTTIRIELLRDAWSEAQLRRCWRGVLVDKLRQMVPHQRAALPYRRRPVSRAAMGPSLRRDDKVDAILLATRLKRHSSPSADSAQPDFRRPVSNV